MVIPGRVLRAKFSEIVLPFHEQALALEEVNQLLARSSDRLISVKLSVENLDIRSLASMT